MAKYEVHLLEPYWSILDNDRKIIAASFHVTVPYAQDKAISLCFKLNTKYTDRYG